MSLPPSASSLQGMSTSYLLSPRVTKWQRPTPHFPASGGKPHQTNHSPTDSNSTGTRYPDPGFLTLHFPGDTFGDPMLRAHCWGMEQKEKRRNSPSRDRDRASKLRGRAGPPTSGPEPPRWGYFSTPSVFNKFGLQADPVGLRNSRRTAGPGPPFAGARGNLPGATAPGPRWPGLLGAPVTWASS